MNTTDNYRKHKSSSTLQQKLLNNFEANLLKEIRVLNPQSILDVGCGEGFTLEKLRKAKIGTHLEGVDFLDLAIKLGKKNIQSLRLSRAAFMTCNIRLIHLTWSSAVKCLNTSMIRRKVWQSLCSD